MWTCPKCETRNKGDKCPVCGMELAMITRMGIKKPLPKEEKKTDGGTIKDVKFVYRRRPPKRKAEDEKDKKQTGLIVALAGIVGALLIVLVVVLCVNAYNSNLASRFDTEYAAAEMYFDENDFNSCINKLNSMKSNGMYSGSCAANTLEGKAYMEIMQYHNAIPCFEAALRIEDNTDNQVNLAVCYAKTGQKEKANEILSDDKMADRKDLASYIKGEISESDKKYDEAVDYFRYTIDNTREESLKRRAYIEIARVYRQRRHEDKNNYTYIKKEIEVLEEAVRVLKCEDDITICEMMGEAYFTGQKYDLAVMKFERLIQLGYNRPYIYRNIAIIHQQTGNFSEAENALVRMRDNYPEDYTCYMQFAFLSIEKENRKPNTERDFGKAYEYYELAKKYAGGENQDEIEPLERVINELRDKGWL